MNGWQDIATAPKDRPILVWDPRQQTARVAFWGTAIEDGDTAWVYAHQLSIHSENGVAIAFIVSDPTYWQPCPVPPTDHPPAAASAP